MWMLDVDYVTWNNHRKQALHCEQLYVTMNYYCSELCNLRGLSGFAASWLLKVVPVVPGGARPGTCA